MNTNRRNEVISCQQFGRNKLQRTCKMSDRCVDMSVYVREKVGYRDARESKKYGKNID